MTRLAMELLTLGVSKSGVEQLLMYSLDEIERQLAYLPYRKAKRPEAFIIEAVRHAYSPPKEFFYASNEAQAAGSERSVDESAQRAARHSAPVPQRHRTPGAPHTPSPDGGLEPGRKARDPLIQDPDEADRPAQ